MDKRYKHLNGEERGVILAEHRRGASLQAIGLLLGRSASTIGRELLRGRPEGEPAQLCCAQLGGVGYRARLAGCWAHSRRRFYEFHTAGDSRVATTTVERMAELWKLETEVRGQSPDARATARQAISAPIVAELFALWQQTLPRISGKSKLAEAIRNAIARRAIFERFLTDGTIELESNIVERAIRPQTITRKNSLFARSDGGGRTWATIATLLQPAR